MKKLFLCAAIVCALCSCTSESYFEPQVVENANESCPPKEDENLAEFLRVCDEIIEMHGQWDYFREVLPNRYVEKIDAKNYSMDEAVLIIYLWWSNERTGEVLIEWTVFDDFIFLLPEKYFDIYPFYI